MMLDLNEVKYITETMGAVGEMEVVVVCKIKQLLGGAVMYEKAAFVFWLTLGLYLVTLFSVSYVGVYLTYVAIPFIALAGLVMLMTKPKKETAEAVSRVKGAAKSTLDEAKQALGVDEFNSWLEEKYKDNERRAMDRHKAKMKEDLKKSEELENLLDQLNRKRAGRREGDE